MNLTEKVAYIKGLAEGLELGTETKEAKILTAVIDLLDDMAFSIAELEEQFDEVAEQVDSIDEDLYSLETVFDELLDDEDDCDCDYDEDVDGDIYEVVCANCGETLYLDEAIIEAGSIDCPGCGELLEFEMDDEE